MIKLRNNDARDQLKKCMQKAIDTNSHVNFLEQLFFLHTYGGGPKYYEVELSKTFDLGEHGLYIVWKQGEKSEELSLNVFGMNGGLVYHDHSNEWGIHT